MKKELIIKAKETIGKATKGDKDWIIEPTRHEKRYRESAPALAEVLSRSDINVTANEFENFDHNADKAQYKFKTAAKRANLAVLLTACIGSIVLVLNGLELLSDSEKYSKTIFLVLGIGAIVVGGLGTMWLYQIQAGKLLENWMSKRAKAETYRLELFNLVSSVPGSKDISSEIPLSLLQLEYFRRYQLDVQIAYYEGAGLRHSKIASKILSLSGIAVFLGTIATGLSGILGSVNPSYTGFAALGVISVALSTFAAVKEGISQDRRNAERYERTRQALVEIRRKLDDIRVAVAENNRKPMEMFISLVHEQISLEHRQWLKSADNTQKSIAMLQKSLDDHKRTMKNQED